MVLHEAVEGDRAAVAAAVGLHARLVVAGVVSPAREVGRAVFIAQRAEGCIGDQPVGVVGRKALVALAARRASAVALEGLAEQLPLGVVHPFVIHLRKGVQLVAQLAVLLVLLDAGLGQPQELRMQGEGRVGVVGVGVLPRAGHRGVVDRQQLDHPLPRGRGPVDEQLQVRKLTDAEALARAEREDRHGRSGAPPAPLGEAGDDGRLDEVLLLGGRAVPDAVGPLLPEDGFERGAVGDQQLVFAPLGQAEREVPLREAAVVERHDPLPGVEAVGGQGQRLVGVERGDGEAERGIQKKRLPRFRPARAALFLRLRPGEDAAGEGRGVERGVGGHLLPAVPDADGPGPGLLGQAERVGPPFGAGAGAVAFDGIAVDDGRAVGVVFDDAPPDAAFVVMQGDAAASEEQHELFAPARAVFDLEKQFHVGFWLRIYKFTKTRGISYFSAGFFSGFAARSVQRSRAKRRFARLFRCGMPLRRSDYRMAMSAWPIRRPSQ